MIRKLSALLLALLLTLTAVPALAEDFVPTMADFNGNWEVLYFIEDGVVSVPTATSDLTGILINDGAYTAYMITTAPNSCSCYVSDGLLHNSWGAIFRLATPDVMVSVDSILYSTILRRVPETPNGLQGSWSFLTGTDGNVLITQDEFSCTLVINTDKAVLRTANYSRSLSVSMSQGRCVLTSNEGDSWLVEVDPHQLLTLTRLATGDVLFFTPTNP